MKSGHTKVLIAVEGGNIRGCRSNNANVIVEVFDQDNLKAEGKSEKQINKMWKTREKKFAYPVY